MNEDQIKGTARKVGGRFEEGIGAIVDDRSLEGEGVIDQVAGAAQSAFGDIKEATKSVYDRASPAVRDRADHAYSIVKDHSLLTVVAVGVASFAAAWALRGTSRSARD